FALADLDSSLALWPDIRLLTDGSRWAGPTVLVKGEAALEPGATVRVTGLAGEVQALVGPDSHFVAQVPLVPGENRLLASADDGRPALSEPVIFTRVTGNLPRVDWQVRVAPDGRVTLDASATADPLGRSLGFRWKADPCNPAAVVLQSPNSATCPFQAPAVPGEYYFDLTVAAGEDTARARAVVLVDSVGTPTIPDLGTWHPAWVDSLILYEIYPRSFSPAGKLRAITGRMDELASLGVTGIWLMPIHPSAMTHGYWITNYFAVNPQYGTERDLRDLVRAAHAHGIRVILDFVVQHTHFSHPFMRDALAYGPASPYYRFYLWKSPGEYEYLFDWRNLPSVNFADSLAPDYFVEVAKYWVREFDVDGYRCDVAWAIDNRREGGPAFWQRLRQELKKLKPDVFLLAEAPSTESNHFDRKFDAAYDGWFLAEIQKLLSGTGSVRKLDEDLRYHLGSSFPRHARPMRYLENHDTDRFIALYGEQATRIAATLLLTVPGIPLVEYGQEVGERSHRGIVQWSDPHGLRPFYRKLIRLRRSVPALRGGAFRTLWAA
ncbi:MAG TPA: hypothetical protein ENK07_09940, partial [Bacteroidetes bacterium]|nr:hypothetical protein [Bacteroidota bacterium]